MAQNQKLIAFEYGISNANSTGLYYSGVINATSITVGTSWTVNSSGAYHTGVINAASYSTGSYGSATGGLIEIGRAHV